MGQYWKIGNLSKKEQIRDCGKLGEFIYQGSKPIQALCNLMATRWQGDKIVVVGDYTERVFEGKNLFSVVCEFKEMKITLDYTPSGNGNYKYLYNHRKKHFVDITKMPIDDDGFIIHPLPLLLAGAENGQSGSDYEGDDMDKIGLWIDDSEFIEVSENPLNLHNSYKELVLNFCIKA